MGNYIWPVPSSSRISCPWGTPRSYGHHMGVDIATPLGNKIVATRAGRVKQAGWKGSYGLQVYLDHGGGITSRYAHCSKLNVRVGDTVKAGQTIALIGSTGHSTGPHLHFELRFNGTDRNPLNYVKHSDTSARFSGSKGTSSVSGGAKGSGKEVTKVKVATTTGKQGAQDKSLRGKKSVLKDGVEILIQKGTQVYLPEVEGEVTLEYERTGTPGKLQFRALDDGTLKIRHGSPVRFRYFGKNVFFGYIFNIKPSDGFFEITAYDQLRYLKNKDVMAYKKKTYSQLLRQIAKQYGLSCGVIANTKFVIEKRIEEGTLFDILGNAARITRNHTKKTYVLYDDFGKLTLRNIANMKLPILIDSSTAQGFDFESTIDGETYNRVKLYTDNSKTGVRKVHTRNSTSKQNRWGILQYTEKAGSSNVKDIKKKSKALLEKYGRPEKKLSVGGCFGDIRVRAGSSLVVRLDLQLQKIIDTYMYVEKVTHKWSNDSYMMDLTLSGAGGEFDA